MMHKTLNAWALELSHLTVIYRNHQALLDVSLQIPAGLLVAIAGPNGAGKSTLLQAVLGMVNPACGSIQLLGSTFDKVRDRVAYVPQRMSVDWDFPISVCDIVLMGCYRRLGWFWRPGINDYHQAYAALSKVGMEAYADRHIAELSGGQQQRVFLARALMQDADLYLMDEPFNGVDIHTEQTMITILKLLCAQGKTVIIVHHDLLTLTSYFDWVVLLNQKVIACGPTHQMMIPEYVCQAYGHANVYLPNMLMRERQL